MLNRNIISIDDLSLAEIERLFEKAREIGEDLHAWATLCPGTILATLFYEASTRTRLSFESAMLRLGGGVITAADMGVSSASKGESLADTVRVVSSSYADILVLRHCSEGAARLAAQVSGVPVINGGDGSHEHPTQTLCDLYSLWIERGRIQGLDVVLAGDLRYSRTIHSFVYALARFGANIISVPQPGFELPEYVVKRLREEFGVEPVRANAGALGQLAAESDVLYLTPHKPHQLSLFTDARGWDVNRVDAVYMTRPQTERYPEGSAPASRPYLQLGKLAMAHDSLRDALVMHPLPRRDEISSDIDADPRSIYFKQAARGVPIRMALLAALLGRIDVLDVDPPAALPMFPMAVGAGTCPNRQCITATEPRHVVPLFKLASRYPWRVYCGFCSHEITFELVGCSTTRVYHRPDSPTARRLREDHLVFLRDAAHANALGFHPSARSTTAPAAPPD
jgi:aspartate carbamoyltransferase catalytic subunit